MSKPPFLPPMLRAGREAPPIAGRSDKTDYFGFYSFLAAFLAFCSALNLLSSSIFFNSCSVCYVPCTSTIVRGFLGSSTFGSTGLGISTFGGSILGASILGGGTSTLGSSFGGSAYGSA